MIDTARRLLATALFFLAIAGAVFAGGQQEDPIRRARELVAENRINDAILLLEETVRNDPERIQEAEALMRTIREIRGEYNVLFEQLIDNLVNNPDDIERTLEIIDQMEALDEFPNERVVEQVEDARFVAQLAFDRNLFQDRMDQAREHLDAGRYLAAVEVYESLTDLQRDRFENRGYGDIFLVAAEQVVAELAAIRGAFSDALPPYRAEGEGILDQARRDVLTLTAEDLEPFFAEAQRMSDIVERVDAAAQQIAVTRSQVPLQFPDEPVDWYLVFQEMIARGRPEYRGEEGLEYAVREAYRETIGQLAEAGREQTTELLALAESAADADRYDTAAQRYETATQTAVLWEQAVAVQSGVFADTPALESVVEQVGAENAIPVVEARAHRIAAESLVGLADTLNQFVTTETDRQATLFSLQSQIAAAESIVSTLQAGREAYTADAAALRELPPGARSAAASERIDATAAAWNRGVSRAIDRERGLAVAISRTRTDGVPDQLGQIDERLAELAPLNEGVEVQDEGDEAVVRTVRYPDRALEGYQETETTLVALRERVDEAATGLAAENEYVREGPGVTEESRRLDGLATRIDTLLATVRAGADTARNLIAQAEARRQDALDRIADTRAAIAAFQVEPARNNYAAAREAFLESLALREDPAVREQSDELIQQVGAELQELENVIVVRRVRELITQAEDLYNQDEYVAARDTLLAAEETWSQTNVDPNTEIERLLRLVTAALSLEEGRELAVTDPLYTILGNYLSIAREDYNRARRLYDAGNRVEAEPLFDRAIENLRNVRDVRPLNWDARILELRIAQIRNADDFDEVFAARYEQAVDRIDEAGPLQAYSELEVLAEINPDYPGLQNQLRRLEIALNLREDPVDQARINQAAQLYNRAQNLAAGSRDQVAVAVSLLEEAVQLNPNNNDAKFLLDQLRIQLGGQATVALTSADEEQYRRAETLFSQGRVLQALQITERLLADGNNENYPPLVDLRRRIALRLGI